MRDATFRDLPNQEPGSKFLPRNSEESEITVNALQLHGLHLDSSDGLTS